jgi:hypothetical protein
MPSRSAASTSATQLAHAVEDFERCYVAPPRAEHLGAQALESTVRSGVSLH